MVIEKPAYQVIVNKKLLKHINSFLPGCSAINWKNGSRAISLGYLTLLQQFSVNMVFTPNSTILAAHTYNIDMFKWVVKNIGVKINSCKDWARTLDTLAISNQKTILRWLILIAPNKLNFKLDWCPQTSFSKVIIGKQYEMVRWFYQHHEGIIKGSTTIEPLDNETLTSNYLILLNSCPDMALLKTIYDQVKYKVTLPEIVRRCLKKCRIEITHHIFKDWNLDEKINFIHQNHFSRSSPKLHEYLLISDYLKNLPMSPKEIRFRKLKGQLMDK